MDDLPWVAVTHSVGESSLSLCKHAYTATGLQPHVTASFVTLVGRRSKSAVLRQMIQAYNDPRLHLGHNDIYLWGDPKTRRDKEPMLFLDCESQNLVSQARSLTEYGYDLPRRIAWLEAGHRSVKRVGNMLCARVLAPLSNAVCYFASDVGGLRGVASLLAEQAVAPCPTIGVPQAVLPRLLVIVDTTSATFDPSIAETKLHNLISAEMGRLKEYRGDDEIVKDIASHFHSIRVLGLNQKWNQAARAAAFRKRLASVSSEAQECRRAARLLFSFSHFEALSQSLAEHFCDESSPFSLIRASRPKGFSAEDFFPCLQETLNLMPSQAWLWHYVVPLTASCLLLASYPPGSHHFDPRLLFSEFYFNACERAIQMYTIHQEVQSKFLSALEMEFCSLFDCLTDASSGEAKSIHLQRLEALSAHSSTFKSHKACLCCMMRMPEKVLDCGHATCDVCVKIFGQPSATDRYTYIFRSCQLCRHSHRDSHFQFLPPTAGIRVLSMDGGGIRGIISLTFLKHIEDLVVGLHCPLREFFDYVCGSSAGGLIALGMFVMMWSAQDCLRRFKILAMETFQRRRSSYLPVLKLQKLILSSLKDYRYESSAIEDAFKKDIRGKIQLFNPLRSETKVAVTTTTARDSLPCLLSNYNGGRRPPEYECAIVRAQLPEHDISISEAASCTSAAPWFFKAKFLKNLGTFQDGGLRHNNPIRVTMRECQFIWPEKVQSDPDFALSLGTGTSLAPTYRAGPHSPVKDRFYSRLFESFMSGLDGEKAWNEFYSSLPKTSRPRYHRLNLRFRSREPPIDDLSSSDTLEQEANAFITTSPEVKPLLDAMYASSFYFELEDVPKLVDGTFQCSGHIYCRLNLDQQGREYLYNQLRVTSSFFLISGQPVPCVESVSKGCPLFRRRVHFTTVSMAEIVSISIRGITSSPKMISGLPKPLEYFISTQELDARFGRIDHKPQGKPLPRLPVKRKYQNISAS